jgi:hypothetical protein
MLKLTQILCSTLPSEVTTTSIPACLLPNDIKAQPLVYTGSGDKIHDKLWFCACSANAKAF